MPSKNMLKKGKRRHTVKPAYRAHRDALRDAETAGSQQLQPAAQTGQAEPAAEISEPLSEPNVPGVDASANFELEEGVRSFVADATAKGKRLDAYLAKALPDVSRARVQLLIDDGQVRVDGEPVKASLKLAGGERIEIEGEPQPAPLKAEPEDIPLKVVYEDADLAVIDKPAGMVVHAGAGDAEQNRGTLVNALLFHFGKQLSDLGGTLRPGIVHRLDKETSGLILVAKNDVAHRRLAEMFATRALEKTYIALVHGLVAKDEGTVDLPIGRDAVRRTRMSTRRSVESGARAAVSHWRVLERIGTFGSPAPLGNFTLVEVRIETGRTHQIRVHMAAIGHPVVGDKLYGAPGQLKPAVPDRAKPARIPAAKEPEPTLDRNFLHAAELSIEQPRSGEPLELRSPLPPELEAFLGRVRGGPPGAPKGSRG